MQKNPIHTLTAAIGILLLVGACGSKNVKERPDWIDNPGDNVVGRCGTHVKGPIYQEECAYKKGLAYMAMSKGVSASVVANMDLVQTSDGQGTSKGRLQASVAFEGEEIYVKGRIIDKWRDTQQDIFYVLIKDEE